LNDGRGPTKEAFYCYYVRSGWERRPETPVAIGAKFVNTLDALSRIDPIFKHWEIADIRNSSTLPLAEARLQMASLVDDWVVRNDFKEPVAAEGYHAQALAGKFRDPRSAIFKIDAGGEDDGGTELEFADLDVPPDPAIVTYPLCKAALLAINATWRTPWACAQAFRSGSVSVPIDFGGVPASRIEGVRQVPLDSTFPYSIFHIPWIAYLSGPLAAGLRLPSEILTERTPDGGLLMTATKERLDPDNPEHARRARVLAET
jgi:hypothetical protein